MQLRMKNLYSDWFKFKNTTESKALKFYKAMIGPNKKKWERATDEEPE
jgi:hypothetical protein